MGYFVIKNGTRRTHSGSVPSNWKFWIGLFIQIPLYTLFNVLLKITNNETYVKYLGDKDGYQVNMKPT